MSFLNRNHAPVSEEAWSAIDDEARRTLEHFLSARRLVDFKPVGDWTTDAVGTGRLDSLSSPTEDVRASVRQSQPMIELRAEFSVARQALDAVDRGAENPDLHAVVEAARQMAVAEDRIVFHGTESAHVEGLVTASPHPALPIDDDYSRYPNIVAEAAAVLRDAGVGGPFGIALGPRCHRGVIETTEKGGYPTLEHIRLILGGPVVWAPQIDGAVVLSLRGDDFRLLSGMDMAIGYACDDRESVTFFLAETLTFSNLSPHAAVVLEHAS